MIEITVEKTLESLRQLCYEIDVPADIETASEPPWSA
jgi:hypothetical protein